MSSASSVLVSDRNSNSTNTMEVSATTTHALTCSSRWPDHERCAVGDPRNAVTLIRAVGGCGPQIFRPVLNDTRRAAGKRSCEPPSMRAIIAHP